MLTVSLKGFCTTQLLKGEAQSIGTDSTILFYYINNLVILYRKCNCFTYKRIFITQFEYLRINLVKIELLNSEY